MTTLTETDIERELIAEAGNYADIALIGFRSHEDYREDYRGVARTWYLVGRTKRKTWLLDSSLT